VAKDDLADRLHSVRPRTRSQSGHVEKMKSPISDRRGKSRVVILSEKSWILCVMLVNCGNENPLRVVDWSESKASKVTRATWSISLL
jgi:hypothetical protein